MKEGGPSWRTREEILRGLGAAYDLIVVGGGITGCAVSHEASAIGYRVLLLEKGDLGSGTSGKTSRLIHGGLRYLKYGKMKMVHQGTRERYWLRTNYPHLVRPLAFLIPFYEGVGEGPLATLFGLWLYDLLSGFSNVKRHRRLGPKEVMALEPNLRTQGLRGGALYYDCFVDDARLVLLNGTLAFRAGAHILTYAKVEGLIREDGRVQGVQFRDVLRDETHEARGRVVINATGPWSDDLRLMLPSGRNRLRPTKGIHVFLPRSNMGPRHAIVMRSPLDERVVFALPWRDLTLVGTTDTDFRGNPDEVRAEAEDVGYLLDTVNHTFPGAHLAFEDVVSSYAGLRPLLAQYGVPESEVTRDFKVVEDAPGLISILGGKLTTYRRAARKAVKKAMRMVGRANRLRSEGLGFRDLRMTDAELEVLRESVSGMGGLDPQIVDRLVASYGRDCHRLRTYLEEGNLRQRIVPELPYIYADVVFAVEQELALRLQDVLVRRTGLVYEDAGHGLSVAKEVASLMAKSLGWGKERIDQEISDYEKIVAEVEAFRWGG